MTTSAKARGLAFAASTPPFQGRSLFLAIPSVVFVALLALTELTVRWALPPLSPLDVFVTAPRQQAQFVDAAHVRITEGDPLLFWRLRPNLRDVPWDAMRVSTNAQGLRYDHAVERKAPRAFRIVCVGDSVTFGYRVPRVYLRRPRENPEWLPYPMLLERWLRAANPGRSIEVIPLATPGYSSHQGLAWLRRDVGGLDPDVVTVCFGWNDIDLRAQSDAQAMKTDGPRVTARRIVSHSQALMRASRWLAGARAPDRPMPDTVRRVSRERFVDNELEMAHLARRHGAAAVLIGTVYRDRVAHPPEGDVIAAYRDALREAAHENGIPYLEVPELTEASYPANARLFEEHIHPNHRGHRVLALALLGFLRDQRLLADLAVPALGPAGDDDASPQEPPP
jgi:lysophospholipase L1-like esterase